MATYLEQSLEMLTEFEGSVPWMYLDTSGHVTVGVGMMLANAAAALALPFRIGGGVASREQIVLEFARVRGMEPGLRSGAYRCGTSPELGAETIQELLRSMLVGFETPLRQGVRGYDELPDAAKVALLDMVYNLGPVGLLRGYPKLLAALAARSWTAAAAECLRHGISAERNAWTRLQFLSSATEAEVATVIQAVAARSRSLLAWMSAATLGSVLVWSIMAAWRSARRSRSRVTIPKWND